MEYWIDGYNVIGCGRWTESMTLEQAREKLLRSLVPLGEPVRVWFDAAKPGAPAAAARTSPDPRVTVVFVRDRTADAAMIEAVAGVRAGTVTLVTDDRELRGRARQLGAGTLGVEKFLQRLAVANVPKSKRVRPAAGRRDVTSGALPGAEVEDWMRWFGFTGDEDGGAGLPGDAQPPEP